MKEKPLGLSSHVNLMGSLLGDAIRSEYGHDFFQKIERIRTLSKSSRAGDDTKGKELLQLLNQLKDDELQPVVQAFSQFLNFANIAEQYHATSPQAESTANISCALDALFIKLREHDFSGEQIRDAVSCLDIELVLTAHPTEVIRRTLIHKYTEMSECLEGIQYSKNEEEKNREIKRLEQLIWQAWHTDELRHKRPTPVDEAKWGLATVEHSLWKALPDFTRILNEKLFKHTGLYLPPEVSPVRFASWMGGDRDGNPNVTAKITRKILFLNRHKGATLYMEELKKVIIELSMKKCSAALRMEVGDTTEEPYRAVLSTLYDKLSESRDCYEKLIAEEKCERKTIIKNDIEILEPLQLCHESLCECGLEIIANGCLLDLIHRVKSFGLGLIRLDIRQEADSHTQALSELTAYLDIGDYAEWTEEVRQEFLLKELLTNRPLIPSCWSPTGETQEVIDVCRIISEEPSDCFGSYIISMAQKPSDVLAVILLLKKNGCQWHMPVAPLFETLNDLNNAGDSVKQLLDISWYREYAKGQQMIMIGYSDSAKDAGQLAAAWAQYRAMETITDICKESNIKLTLFHGRGGTVGRGGGPAHAAVLSQPPGSVDSRLRVTEQGEMIRFKFGFPKIAIQNMVLYTSATLEASLLPPPAPEIKWRDLMDKLAMDSFKVYRETVQEDPCFLSYFRTLTPERELRNLRMSSRPPKRNMKSEIKGLRAIPWIFSWAQCRLMLPVWLGSGTAIQNAIDNGEIQLLKDMMAEWPFFRSRIEMLEMVFLKTDMGITKYYEDLLVPEELHSFGEKLRNRLRNSINAVIELKGHENFMDARPWEQKAIRLRNPYSDPLHMLQAELLKRIRVHHTHNDSVEKAMMMTIAGIAAGMRNTG